MPLTDTLWRRSQECRRDRDSIIIVFGVKEGSKVSADGEKNVIKSNQAILSVQKLADGWKEESCETKRKRRELLFPDSDIIFASFFLSPQSRAMGIVYQIRVRKDFVFIAWFGFESLLLNKIEVRESMTHMLCWCIPRVDRFLSVIEEEAEGYKYSRSQVYRFCLAVHVSPFFYFERRWLTIQCCTNHKILVWRTLQVSASSPVCQSNEKERQSDS